MTAASLSVVVVSRDRPVALRRCILGLLQVQYTPFEVVVVADAAGCQALAETPWHALIKIVEFDEPNISKARNLGISHAAGDIVAFIDDDAVPEPSWLAQLIAPMREPRVGAVGGYVRGRNGISFQWTARSVDPTGATAPLDVDPGQATIWLPKGARAIKTEGTNMAVRRDILLELEGFDPAFAFYLDETDLNLRLARAGHATAIVPMAEVHHGFAASVRRRADRVPRDLFDIGASWAVFQRKHMPESKHMAHWRDIRRTERVRLIEHMVAGRLLPGDVTRLMRRLATGYDQGMTRQRGGAQLSQSAVSPFRPLPFSPRPSVVLTGRIWQRTALRAEAARRAREGEIVTLILLSFTGLYHHVRFDPEGYWEQSGGVFGRSVRDKRVLTFFGMSQRLKLEVDRVSAQRLIGR